MSVAPGGGDADVDVPLLDVNVLVSLAWPNHVHHDRAHAWFAGIRSWATCPLTQSGFVRVSSNRNAIPDAKTPAEAIALLAEMVSLKDHRFWEDSVSIAATDDGAFERVVSYRQVTDAHLVELALMHGGHVATFDRAIRRLAPRGPRAEAVVRLIP